MTTKPTTIEGYAGEYLGIVRSTCLYVATKLGDFLDDIVIVGGLAPSLLVDQTDRQGLDAHAGTRDLDMGLALAILEEERYRELSVRLRDAGFARDMNDKGNRTNQRWRINDVTVDFLIPPSDETDKASTLLHIESDFAAIITPGLELAFQDRRKVEISDFTLFGERARRNVWVCGPGAFVVLKALAVKYRGENKDAYDLMYVLNGVGIDETARCLSQRPCSPTLQEALEIIREDFTVHDGIGPMRVARFKTGAPDDDIQADVVGVALEFLDRVATF